MHTHLETVGSVMQWCAIRACVQTCLGTAGSVCNDLWEESV